MAAGSIVIDLLMKTGSFVTDTKRAQKELTNSMKAMRSEVARTADSLSSITSGIKSLAGMAAVGFSINGAIQAADAWGQYNSRLKQATESQEEFESAQKQLMDTSNRTFKNFGDAYELFIRTNNAIKELGYSSKETADLVSTIQFGLTIDSATPEKTKSVIDAMTKSLLKGKMGMDEFNTVIASSPTLFKAMADSITNGSQAALRELVAQGKLTADQLLQITQQMQSLGEQADNMPATVADAFTKLNNQFTQYVGNANEATGATSAIVSIINFASEHIKLLGDIVISAAAGWAVYKTTLAGVGLAKTISQFLGLIPAVKASATATAVATTATRGLTVAQRALAATPLGLVFTAAAAAISYFAFSMVDAEKETKKLGDGVDYLNKKAEELTKNQAIYAIRQATDEMNKLKTEMEAVQGNIKRDAWQAVNYADTDPEESRKASERHDKELAELDELKQKYEEVRKKKESLDNYVYKNSTITQNIEFKGMEKWDEYVKKLEDARNLTALNARAAAEYKAVQEGANEVQAHTAGIIVAQQEAFGNLKNAIENKDQSAIAGSEANIRALAKEQAQAEIVAQQMVQIKALMDQLQGGTIAVADYVTKVTAINTQAHEQLADPNLGKDVADKQIETIRKNAVPKASRSGGGGGRAKSSGGAGGGDDLTNLIKQLKEQQATIKMTEAEQQKYKVTMMSGTQEMKNQAIALIDNIARTKELAEAQKEHQKALDEIEKLKNTKTLEITTMGMSATDKANYEERYNVIQAYYEKRLELERNQEDASTRISQEAYQVRLANLQDEQNQQLQVINTFQQQRQELEGSWTLGLSKGLNDYAEQAQNVYSSLGSAVQNWASESTNALTDFVMTGKADFKGLANSIIKDLIRIFIQQKITGLFASAMGGMFGGTATATAGMSNFQLPEGFTAVTFATGGSVWGAGTATSDSIPAMLSNGEFVVRASVANQSGVRQFLEMLNNNSKPLIKRASGGSVGTSSRSSSVFTNSTDKTEQNVTININNNSSQAVKGSGSAKFDQFGRMIIDVMLGDLSKNGQYAQALTQKMGK